MQPDTTKPRLLDQLCNTIRLLQYSIATEKVYLHWVKRFILFHGKRHPESMGKGEVECFLTHLAVNRGVSPSTQNVALAAILFLYTKVLNMELPALIVGGMSTPVPCAKQFPTPQIEPASTNVSHVTPETLVCDTPA